MELFNAGFEESFNAEFEELYVVGDLTDKEIEAAVKKYFEENGMPSYSTSKISEVTLLANAWQISGTKYSQVVSINGVTENSQVDLTPSDIQLEIFREKNVAFTTANDNGVVTVFAFGQKPQHDYVIQVTLTELSEHDGVIYGVTVETPINPQTLIENTSQAKQIEKNTEDISSLQNEIEVTVGNIDALLATI